MKRTIAVLAIIASGSALGGNPVGVVEFGIGAAVVNDANVSFDNVLDDDNIDVDFDKGVSFDAAYGMNYRVNDRFSNGIKVTVDHIARAEADTYDPEKGWDKDEFDITTLALNYDLDWRFVRPISLLFSTGAGFGWSDIFPDDWEFVTRASLGLGFHVAQKWQITLAGIVNYFPEINYKVDVPEMGRVDVEADYTIVAARVGFRYEF